MFEIIIEVQLKCKFFMDEFGECLMPKDCSSGWTEATIIVIDEHSSGSWSKDSNQSTEINCRRLNTGN